jgi:dihydrodipicolinate synthase/N-acetylneuraminate lyase
LRRELMERVCRQVDGRVPVLVAVSDTAYEETLRVAEWAAAAGAASIVLAPPYYLPVSQADLLRLIESLADSALPLFLYNMPALTKVSFDLETVERASEMPHVAGLKDSSGNMGYLREVLECVRGNASFSVLVGPEHLLAEALVAGADGGVPGGANLFPGLLVKLYAAFERREFVAMHELQEQIVRLGAQIWKSDDEAGAGALRRLKCALNLAGLCSSTPAWPYVESDLAEREQMEEHLRRHGILP